MTKETAISVDIRKWRKRLGLSQAKLSELSQIPQHFISAYELGKSELSSADLKKIETLLSDESAINSIVNRQKRYRPREYKIAPPKDESRNLKAIRSAGNLEYLKALENLHRQHNQTKNHGLKAVSLFSGCGGFSLGFSAAGYDLLGFLELNDAISSIYQDNFPKTRKMGKDISCFSQDDIESLAAHFGKIDIIIGGPPCQGFSLSGKRRVDDPRNTLFRHYLRFVDAFQPKLAVVENVRLLTSMKNPSGGYVKDDLVNSFRAHGYTVRLFEVNAKDFGVPQHRARVFFVAAREDLGLCPSFPEQTHGIDADLFQEGTIHRTFADACSDLPFLESGEKSKDPMHVAVKHPEHVIRWLWDVPQGKSAHDNEDENLRPPSGYNTTYKRQVWSEPASTVQTTFGMISGCRNVHPIATRSLTIREAARIQSFPDPYKFAGTRGAIRTAIGNAVPPLLSYALATHVKPSLL